MKKYLERIFSYITENKKEILPQVFLSYILLTIGFSTNFLPPNIWVIANSLIGFPIFIWSFLRSLGKMDKDGLPWLDQAFIAIVIPFLLLPFLLAVLIFVSLAISDIFALKL